MLRHIGFVAIALILVGTILSAWVVWRGSTNTVATPEPVPPGEIGTFAIYTNGVYGFSLMYPTSAELQETFSTDYHVPGSWRVNALPESDGTPIVSVVTYHTESETSYPRTYTAQVRIGASTNEEEVERCLKVGAAEGETELPDTMLGETRFKTFAFQSAGMMQYVRGVSYRAIHEGACVAIEQIASGSTYREEATLSDISDDVLNAEYDKLTAIVQSFSFARP